MNTLRVLFAMFTASVLCSAAMAEAHGDGKLHVGLILPLSGDGSAYGAAVRNGATIAWNRLSESERSRLVLHYEDDQMQQKSAISAFKKLLSQKQVDVLINATSGTGHALAPIAEQAKVPLISIATDFKISAGKKYVMNFAAAPDALAQTAGAEVKRLGYKRLARITTTQEGTLAMRRSFDSFRAADTSVDPDEDYPIEIKDFRPLIAKIKRAEPSLDAIQAVLIAPQSGIFARQVREAGIKLPIFGFHMFEDSAEFKAANGALAGAWFSTVDIRDSDFVEQYSRTYDDGVVWFAAYGHDALKMVAQLAEKSTDPEAINEGLHTLRDFSGALGTFSALPENRFSLNTTVSKLNDKGTRVIEN